MRAARLHPGEKRLRIVDVAKPTAAGDEVIVRVAGAGVCHSDLHVLDGAMADLLRLPVTMGHEIAGWVEQVGPEAGDLAAEDAVAVMVGWGCGHCRWCVSGHEQLCLAGNEAGSTMDGGFAEYVLVPHRRHCVPLGELDPVAAAPLGDAALSPYAAIKRVRPHLNGGSSIVVIGVGGLGQYAVQLARVLTGATVVAVDIAEKKRETALELGADHAVAAGPDAVRELLELTGGGADAVVDFVGTDETLALGARIVGRRGIFAVLGLAGGALTFGFWDFPPEAVLTTVHAGTIADLHEVVGLAAAGRIAARITTYPLEAINEALDDLRAGRIAGRAVVTPDRHEREELR